MFADKVKAFVAAAVALAAQYIMATFGLDIPMDFQSWIVAGIMSIVTGAFTWAAPNKQRE